MPEFFFNKAAGIRSSTLLKKETLARVFSCEFYEIFKNTFFIEHLRTTAFEKCESSNIWYFQTINSKNVILRKESTQLVITCLKSTMKAQEQWKKSVQSLNGQCGHSGVFIVNKRFVKFEQRISDIILVFSLLTLKK